MQSNTRAPRSRMRWVILGLLALSCNHVVAQQVVLYLDQIEKIHETESGGDELFFSIAAYPSKGRAQLLHVPEFPMHWNSRHLETVKKTPLWRQKLKEGESVQLILALNEQDAGPWNLDDQLGSLKVRVRREGVRLNVQWFDQEKNQFVLAGEGMQAPHEYRWKAEGGEYHLRLRFEEQT